MSEVGDESGFLSGERDYMNMKGGTGTIISVDMELPFMSVDRATSAAPALAIIQRLFWVR